MEEAVVQSDEVKDQLVEVQEQKQDANNEVVVNRSAEEYAKRLMETTAEARDNRKKAATLAKEIDVLKRVKLEEDGKFRELADQWKAEAEAAKKELTDTKSAFVYTTVKSQISKMAALMGCHDADTLTDLIPIDEIPVDEKFNVDKDSVKLMLENLKKKKPYFFGKQVPSIKDMVPGKVEKKIKTLSDMTTREKLDLLVKLKREGK